MGNRVEMKMDDMLRKITTMMNFFVSAQKAQMEAQMEAEQEGRYGRHRQAGRVQGQAVDGRTFPGPYQDTRGMRYTHMRPAPERIYVPQMEAEQDGRYGRYQGDAEHEHEWLGPGMMPGPPRPRSDDSLPSREY